MRTIHINEITKNITVEAIDNAFYEYNQVNNAQKFESPYTGLYKVELWGSGAEIRGNAIHPETVGKGAYTSGIIYLQKGQILYLYVGGTVNSFNGAGPGESYGGGATDVRLINGSWDSFDGLKSRINRYIHFKNYNAIELAKYSAVDSLYSATPSWR